MSPDDNRVDLSSVNKVPKQPITTKLTNLFKNRKKSAGPGRDHLGQFASGSGGLKSSKKLSLTKALPLVLVVALAGGYLVYRSFAGTYTACRSNEATYTYSEACVVESDEAKIVRLYYGIFNRAPDRSGLNYWVGRLTTSSKKLTLTQIAQGFMSSSEFKNKYGTLSNQKFVEAMYPQVFGRAPDAGGLKFWVDRLNAKKVTRESMMVQFTESSEMKRNFVLDVAAALGIADREFSTVTKKYPPSEVSCQGQAAKDSSGRTLCSVDYTASSSGVSSTLPAETVLAALPLPSSVIPGRYNVCYDYKFNGVGSKPVKDGYISLKANLNDINALSQKILFDNQGWGGAVEKAGEPLKRVCNDISITKDVKNIILIPTSMVYPSTEASATKGKMYLNVENITLAKTNAQISFSNEQNPQIYESYESNVGNGLLVKGQKIQHLSLVDSYSVSPSDTQPVWKSTYSARPGENSIWLPYSAYNNTTVKFTIKNSAGQTIIPTLEVNSCKGDGSLCTTTSSKTDTIDLTDFDSTPRVTLNNLKFNLSKSDKITYEISILKGGPLDLPDAQLNAF